MFRHDAIPSERVIECAKKFDFSWMDFNLLEKAFLSQVEAIRKYQPKAVIGDSDFTLRLAAAYTQTPFISLLNGYMTKYYQRTRRLHPDHPAYRFSRKLPPEIFNKIINFSESMAFRNVHKPFRLLAEKYNVKKRKNLLDELEGDYTLILDREELFPQKKLPQSYTCIGPLFHKEKSEGKEFEDLISNGKKNILVAMGSSGDLSKLKFVEEDLFGEFNFFVAGDENALKASHIFSKKFFNTYWLLEKADLLICHGGNGTIYQALAKKVPILCLPSIFEQEWNLQAIEELGIGRRLEEHGFLAYMQIKEAIQKRNEVFHFPEVNLDQTLRNFRSVFAGIRKERSNP